MELVERAPDWFKHEPVPTLVPWNTRLSGSLRTKFFLTGVIFPIVCFLSVALFDFTPSVDTPWQSGDRSVYINLLMSRPTFLFFLPILCYSVVCMAVWCIRPNSSNLFPIRFGLYTGAVLAAQFVGLLLATTFLFTPLFAAIVAIMLAFIIWLAQKIGPKFRRFTILHLLIVTTVVALFLVLMKNVESVFELVTVWAAICLRATIGGAPTLALATFLRASMASRHIHTASNCSANPLMAIAATILWVGSLFLTWKFAVQSMMLEYKKLPVTDPNCFVSSAAAHGHRRFVGSFSTRKTEVPVNLQMCRLKMLEFSLATAFPAVHFVVRVLYNGAGPKLAHIFRHSKWSADLAYILLKPVESIAILVQGMMTFSNREIDEIYR